MSQTGSVREALLVEALGEVATLLDRVEAVVAVLDASRLALIQANTDLVAQLSVFEARMAGITENAKLQAVRHIARRTDEMARSSLDAQTREMEESARTLFRTELAPALQCMLVPLQHLADVASRGRRPWVPWLTHAAIALLASSITWTLTGMPWAH